MKIQELTECEGSTRELGQIKRFLEELSCLELVKVSASAKDDNEKLRITTNLLRLPRASSKMQDSGPILVKATTILITMFTQVCWKKNLLTMLPLEHDSISLLLEVLNASSKLWFFPSILNRILT